MKRFLDHPDLFENIKTFLVQMREHPRRVKKVLLQNFCTEGPALDANF
jgi:hypothetical protein